MTSYDLVLMIGGYREAGKVRVRLRVLHQDYVKFPRKRLHYLVPEGVYSEYPIEVRSEACPEYKVAIGTVYLRGQNTRKDCSTASPSKDQLVAECKYEEALEVLIVVMQKMARKKDAKIKVLNAGVWDTCTAVRDTEDKIIRDWNEGQEPGKVEDFMAAYRIYEVTNDDEGQMVGLTQIGSDVLGEGGVVAPCREAAIQKALYLLGQKSVEGGLPGNKSVAGGREVPCLKAEQICFGD